MTQIGLADMCCFRSIAAARAPGLPVLRGLVVRIWVLRFGVRGGWMLGIWVLGNRWELTLNPRGVWGLGPGRAGTPVGSRGKRRIRGFHFPCPHSELRKEF